MIGGLFELYRLIVTGFLDDLVVQLSRGVPYRVSHDLLVSSHDFLMRSHDFLIVSHRFLVRSRNLLVFSDWISIQLDQKNLGNG